MGLSRVGQALLWAVPDDSAVHKAEDILVGSLLAHPIWRLTCIGRLTGFQFSRPTIGMAFERLMLMKHPTGPSFVFALEEAGRVQPNGYSSWSSYVDHCFSCAVDSVEKAEEALWLVLCEGIAGRRRVRDVDTEARGRDHRAPGGEAEASEANRGM